MSAAAPTFGQIRAQVAAVRRKAGNAQVFGIQSCGRWTGEQIHRDGEETYLIIQCDSPLQMRTALQDEMPGVTAKVLVSSLPPDQVGADILVRLARRKFYPIDKWQIVKELFQARHIDPRVTEHSWVADQILELVSPEGYPPVPSGVLDAETVWRILLERQIGLGIARPDLVALLKWSMDETNVIQYRQAPEPFRVAAVQWIEQFAGPATGAVLSCVRTNDRPDALPVGLALGVVFHEQAGGKLDKAAGRMEKYVGDGSLNEKMAQRWSNAATEVVRLHLPDVKARTTWLQRADEILEAVQGDGYAHLSSTSLLGFSQRLAHFGQALTEALDSGALEVPDRINDTFRAVLEHDQARRGSRRLQRVEMSARLLRWLFQLWQSGKSEPGSLAEAARDHALSGGYVDWARYTLRGGEPVRELSEAYTRIVARVVEVRERQNRRFAQLLRDWVAAGATGGDVVPVERILDEVVAPLAEHAPVLVMVIDGMSYAVFRELVEDITRQDWIELRREDRSPIWPAIAAVPSVTEVSRTSLLCGKLRTGHSADEKVGFAEHAGLVRHCRSGVLPVLFHKDALQGTEDSNLAANVIKEIESTRRRVVGVVINAVDDQLLKGEQLDIRWTSEEIKVLSPLLYEARAAGRIVVLTSDHGHILDQQTQQRQHEGGDRWRPDDGAPRDDEIQITGERVVEPPEHRLIAPWSEKVRYGMKKNGYHGGVTMQEMIIPLAVLSARDDLPEGWMELPVDTPDWWFTPLEERVPSEDQSVVRPTKRRRKKKPGLLFDMEAEEVTAAQEQVLAAPVAPGEAPGWLAELFKSPVLKDQKKLGGRAVPPDDAIRAMLAALSEQGGKMTLAALARKMQLPSFRLRSLLAAVQRVLNVEGYPILNKDEASDTVELNSGLLCRQFDLT